MCCIGTLSCWCNAVDSFVKGDYSLALGMGIDVHNSYNRKVWCLSDLERSVTFISHSALCFSLFSPDRESPLTTHQLFSDSVLWDDSLTTNLPWVSFPLSLSLSLCGVRDYRGRWWEQWAVAFPSHSPEDCCGARSPPLASALAPRPLGPSDVGKAWEGVPLSRQSFQAPNLSPQPFKPRQQSSWLMLRFMSVFLFVCLALLLHLASDQTESATHVAVGVSEVWNAPVSCDFLLPLKKICVNICLGSLKQSRETDWHSFDGCSPPLNLWSQLFFSFVVFLFLLGFLVFVFFSLYCFCNKKPFESLLL